jgi:hypothetical protein
MQVNSPWYVVFDALGWISIGLLVVLAILLLLGPFRKYPLILSYCLIQLALTAGENYLRQDKSRFDAYYATLYWTDEITLNLLLFLMVIVFTYRALGDSPMRAAMGKLLGGVFVIVLLLPLLIFKGPAFRATSWLNHTSQLLSFCAAILNLGLWSALVANRKRDAQLLSISAGLGIAVTGAAISYGVRGFFRLNWIWVPDVFMSATFVVCMCIWCWALRPKRAALPVQSTAL